MLTEGMCLVLIMMGGRPVPMGVTSAIFARELVRWRALFSERLPA